MLDKVLSLQSRSVLPPFTASYLEHRVKNEPNHGNSALLCIRQIAERLTTETGTTHRHIASLCVLAASASHPVRCIFLHGQPPCITISEEEFEKHLKAAAIYMNHVTDVEAWKAPRDYSQLFGGYFYMAIKYGSPEMVELYLRDATIYDRRKALHRAALHGRTETVRFIFDHYMKGLPLSDIKLSAAWLTPDPKIWDYFMQLHREYRLDTTLSLAAESMAMSKSMREGWATMFRHLLQYGIDPGKHKQIGLRFVAAKGGHTDIIRAQLDWGGSNTTGCDIHAMRAAASNGHLETVQLLLTHSADPTGAVVAAARGGYGDIVKLLLENGANPNEDNGELPAICYAVLKEHSHMCGYLLEYGASLPDLAMREKCEKRAEAKGVESMLSLLKPRIAEPRMNEIQ